MLRGRSGISVLAAGAILCAGLAAQALAPALAAYYTPEYVSFRAAIIAEFKRARPGRFSEFASRGRAEQGDDHKVIALTFDACGGRTDGYNKELIDYLRAENIPATLFVTGVWIDKYPKIFAELAADPLFEIENHGLMHRLCSTEGRSMYGVRGTRDLGGVIDEMELGARKIALLTGRRPIFFRSATAYTDELSRRVAGRLGMEVVSYDILSGDANRASARTMSRNILAGARHGAVVLMHFNHPEWPVADALRRAVPELRRRGFHFSKLEDFTVK
ncbi:MAG: polysaccharide deacetylase family protein [Elusimicrobiales bacterium]